MRTVCEEDLKRLTTVRLFRPCRNPQANAALALKNADDMLKDIMKSVDTDGDGVIKYEGMLGPGV